MSLVWCEVDTQALAENLTTFRRLCGPGVILAPPVKANAYGHGLELAARAFLQGGADWLAVNALFEARALRAASIECPLYVLGYVESSDLEEAIRLDLRMVLYTPEQVPLLGALSRRLKRPVRVHLKLETGNNRQGVPALEALKLADLCREHGVEVEGISSHFANVEDTTDHAFAREQLRRFLEGVDLLRAHGHPVPLRHIANSAATLLWPDARLELARMGISAYGMWPSTETLVSHRLSGQPDVALKPALTWKTRVAQLKSVPVGEFIGYGCTFMTTHATRLAILPVGYFDGYDRALSNLAYVLIRGIRAPLRGRVCMNIIMVDVTDVPGVDLEDEVVLMGSQGRERISAELLAGWAGTINYEMVSRIGVHVPRVPRPAPPVAT